MAIKNYKPNHPRQGGICLSQTTPAFPRMVLRRACWLLWIKKPAATATAASPSAIAAAANRKKYRIIDFKRQKHDVEATVLSIEYDPNRSAFIALVQYEDG